MPHEPTAPSGVAKPTCPTGKIAQWNPAHSTGGQGKWECVPSGSLTVAPPSTTPAGTTTALATGAPPAGSNPHIQPQLNDQCFLLEKAKEIYAVRGKGPMGKITKDKQAKDHLVRQLGVAPFKGVAYNTNLKYVNKITLLHKTRNFFEITPEEAAQLSHYAVIYVANRKGKFESLTPIFTNAGHKDIGDDAIFQSSGKRTGAGIKSIDITFEGIDSATSKIILVNAQYIFQDLRTMLSAPYVELFRIATTDKVKNKKTFRTIDFELGWKSHKTLATKLNLEKLALKVRTHLVKYTFDLKQDGSVSVNAQYRGHIINTFSGPDSNILSLSRSLYTSIRNNVAAIQDRSVKVANQAAATAEEMSYRKIAKQIIRKDLLEKGTVTGTGSSQSIEEAIKSQTGLPSVGTYSSHIDKLSHNSNLHAAQIGAAFNHAQVSMSGPGVDRIKADIASTIAALRQDIKLAIEAPAGSTTGNTYHDQATRQANVAEIMKKYTDMTMINNIAKAEGTAEAARKGSINNAMQEQLKQAKMAKFVALQEIAKLIVSDNVIQYAYIKSKPPPANVNVFDFKIAAATRRNDLVKTAMAGMPASSFLASRSITEDQLNEEEYQVIPFIFLGKLIENVLKLPTAIKADGTADYTKPRVHELMRKNSGENFYIDFGYVSYKQPYTGIPNENFPLYYLPISLIKINNFFSREIIAKEREFYPFDKFLLAVINKFLTGIFQLCTSEANTEHFISPKIQTVVGKYKKKTQYFIYGFKNVIADIKDGKITFGSYNSNWRNHVFHFYLGGQIKGAVKNVKVVDIADENTKSAVYFRNRASARAGAEPTLSRHGGLAPVIFQAEIETMGFPLFNMGQLIYVDLKPYIVDKNNRQFKANGYYGVHKVAHSFSEAALTSKVSAIIQYSKKDFIEGVGKTGVSGKPADSDLASKVNSSVVKGKLDKVAKERNKLTKQVAWMEDYIEGGYTEGSEVDAGTTVPGRGTDTEVETSRNLTDAKDKHDKFMEEPKNKLTLPNIAACNFKLKYPKEYKVLTAESHNETLPNGGKCASL